MEHTVDTLEERNEFLNSIIESLEISTESLENDDSKDYKDALNDVLNNLNEFKIKFDAHLEDIEPDEYNELSDQYEKYDDVVDSIESLSANCESEEEFTKVVEETKDTLLEMID